MFLFDMFITYMYIKHFLIENNLKIDKYKIFTHDINQ